MASNNSIIRRVEIWLPSLLSVVLVSGMIIGKRMGEPEPPMNANDRSLVSRYLEPGRVEEIIRYLEAKYVDKVNGGELTEEAIKDILSNLDPHSSYISREEVEEVNESLEGNFSGIGVEFMMLEDTILVVSTIPKGPASSAGVKPGDRIIAINDSVTTNKSLNYRQIVKLLRGPKDSNVKLSVKREGSNKTLVYQFKRGSIDQPSLDVATLLEPEVGYIKIARFTATTYNEFMKALEELVKKRGMKHLVLDVRQNPGGYLEEATQILSQLFEEKGKLLVYTEGRASNRKNYTTSGRMAFKVDKLAILVDEGSASAAEILAGAIQDQDRGVVIGRRSFGKGLVQEQYPLRDGSALRLTVARYYTPSGRCIQKPYDRGEENYDADLEARLNHGELTSEKEARGAIGDTTQYKTSDGRIVYGGGGIMPDVFIPIDTLLLNEDFTMIRQMVPQFAWRWMERHPETLKPFNSADQYIKDGIVPASALTEFFQYAGKKGSNKNNTFIQKIKPIIAVEIKAQTARMKWNDEAYFKIISKEDKVIQKALQTLRMQNPMAHKG